VNDELLCDYTFVYKGYNLQQLLQLLSLSPFDSFIRVFDPDFIRGAVFADMMMAWYIDALSAAHKLRRNKGKYVQHGQDDTLFPNRGKPR